MRILCFIICLSFACNTNAQVYKIYGAEEISERKFKKLTENYVFLPIESENKDTLYAAQRSLSGFLEGSERYLELLALQKKEAHNKHLPTLVIYFPNIHVKNQTQHAHMQETLSRYEHTLKRLNQISPLNTYYVTNNELHKIRSESNYPFQIDTHQFLKSRFLFDEIKSQSFIYFKPGGMFEAYLGEFASVQIEEIHDNQKVYFDDQGIEITREVFLNLLDQGTYIDVVINENEKKLTPRLNRGEIKNMKEFYQYLSQHTETTLEEDQPLIIRYNSGMIDCTDNVDKILINGAKKDILTWNKKINKLNQSNFLYLSSALENMGKWVNTADWKMDPENTMKSTFFPEHYLCGSFVILFPDTTYYAYKGEYWGKQIVDLMKEHLQIDEKKEGNKRKRKKREK